MFHGHSLKSDVDNCRIFGICSDSVNSLSPNSLVPFSPHTAKHIPFSPHTAKHIHEQLSVDAPFVNTVELVPLTEILVDKSNCSTGAHLIYKHA